MRWALSGPKETKVLTEGDARFNGLDMTRDRAILEPGTLAVSQNKRLINGIAATRPGCQFPADFNPGFTNQLVGSGVFSNPNGDEMLLVAELNANFVWALQFGKDAVKIPIVAGTLSSTYESGICDCFQVKFVQAYDHVYLLRRPSGKHSTLIWDGTLPPSSTANFTPVTQVSTPGTGDIIIPGGVYPSSFSDGVSTSGSAIYTSVTADFVSGDVGKTITGTNIPAATTILSVTSPTQITLSANATASGSALSFTIVSRTPFVRYNCPWNGEPFAERILLYNDQFPARVATPTPDRDSFIMTNSEEWDLYNPATGFWQINSGESNVLTKVMGYYRGGVLCFFRRGIHILENFTLPPPTGPLGDQRMINNFLGLVSNTAAAQIGVDVYFLSEPGKGVYRISEAVQDQIAVNPLAVSDPIQPFMDTINWPQAQYWATMKTLGVYVYLGVPTDTSIDIIGTGNNMIAVFNQYTRQWESIDTFADPNFSFQELQVLSCGGVRQLLAVDWYRHQIYGMYYGGLTDQIGINGTDYPINDVIETRGYTLGDPVAFKRYERLNLGVQTFDPIFNLTSISDGFNERKTLNRVPITKDRLRYYIHGKGKFDPNTGDPLAPKRQDYSLGLAGDYAIEDFEDLPVGAIQQWPGTLVSPYTLQKQQTLERYQIRQNGRYASIRVDNSQGNCDVLSASVDGIPVQEGVKLVS